MKNLFKNLMLVAVAAMGFTACEQVGVESVAPVVPEVKMTVIAGMDETRTYIDEENNKVQWSEGDKLMVIENEATFRKTSDIAIDGEGKAQFAVSFPETAGAVTYNAIFPASAVNTSVGFTAEELELQVKSTQWATAESFDPTADLLVAKQLEFDAQPTELNMQFKRLVALGKMTLKGLDEGVVKQVIFTAEPGVVVAGRMLVDATTATVLELDDDYTSSSITVNYEGATVNGTENFPVYFTCIPFEMEEMNCFTVQVICDNAVYTRDVEIPDGRYLKFTEGNLGTFTVDMTDCKEEVEVSTTVTDTLTRATTGITGTSYASWNGKTGESGAVYAGQSAGGNESIQLRTTNSNSGVITTASGGNVRKISVEWNSATSDGRTLDIYGKNTAYANPTELYSTSTQGTKLGSIVKGSGKATELEITGDYAYIGMRSNSGAMYLTEIEIEWQTGGGSGDGVEIVIPSFDLTKRQLSFSAEGGMETIEVTANDGFDNIVSAETDAEWLTIEKNGYSFAVTAAENEGFARTANITFSADGCEDIVVAVSQKPNYDAAIEVTVAEFLAAEVDDVTLYRLRGTITNVAETSFGNFDLTDETGTVYIYGLCSPTGAIKYWAESGAELGDDIEIITVRAFYNNPQGKNAIFVEKQRPGTIAFWSFDKTSASFKSEGGVAEIKVSAYNLKEEVKLEFKAGEDGDSFEADYADGVLTISAEANTATEALNATLYVRSGDLEQTITISQAAYVEPGEGGDEPVLVEKTATLSFASTAQRTSYSKSQQVWEQNGLKLTNDKGSGSDIGNYSNPARFYKNSKLTLDAPGNIKSITFLCNNSEYTTAMKNSLGTVTGATVTTSGNNVTVAFSEATSAQFVVASLSGGQVRMNSLSVTYMGEEE